MVARQILLQSTSIGQGKKALDQIPRLTDTKQLDTFDALAFALGLTEKAEGSPTET